MDYIDDDMGTSSEAATVGNGTEDIVMDCIDGNSVWQHLLSCFDPAGCADPLCQAGKAVLRHRLSCQVRSSEYMCKSVNHAYDCCNLPAPK